MSHRHPIFFDPFGKRARRTTFGLVVLIILTFGGLGTAGMVGMFVPPSLGGILESAGAEVVGTIVSTFRSTDRDRIHINPMRNRQLAPEAASIRRLAFMPNQSSAVASLRRNAKRLDGIIPEWITLSRHDGQVSVGLQQRNEPIAQWIRTHASHLAVTPLLNMHLSQAEAVRALGHPETRAQIVSDILAIVAQHQFDGLVLDLEEISLSGHRALIAFLQELGDPLRDEGRTLIFPRKSGHRVMRPGALPVRG